MLQCVLRANTLVRVVLQHPVHSKRRTKRICEKEKEKEEEEERKKKEEERGGEGRGGREKDDGRGRRAVMSLLLPGKKIKPGGV